MKTLIKSLVLFLSVISVFQANAQFGIATAGNTPVGVFNEYYNYAKGDNHCVGFSIVTNQRATQNVNLKAPTSTWASGMLNDSKIGSCVRLRSSKYTKRYWSSKTHSNGQPFSPTQTDHIQLIFKKCGSTLTAKMIKNGSTTFNIQILGVIPGSKGDVLYGTYGTHKGFITISLYKAHCPVG